MPIFPLGTVLNPGLLLPLHIFEERYRQLVRDLVEQPDDAERRFGVVAIREGREVGSDGVRASTGWAARPSCARSRPMRTAGSTSSRWVTTRFRLLASGHLPALSSGRGRLLPELPGDSSAVLAASVATVFAAYRSAPRFGPGLDHGEL